MQSVIQVMFPNSGTVFNAMKLPYTTGTVEAWLEEHEGDLHLLCQPAQSSDMSDVELLW
jgi:hypothetical protein